MVDGRHIGKLRFWLSLGNGFSYSCYIFIKMQNLKTTVECESFTLWESKMADDRHLGKRYIAKNHQILTKFCMPKQTRTLTKILRPKLKLLKFKMADGHHIGKHRFSSGLFCRIAQNLTVMISERHKFQTLKIQNGERCGVILYKRCN